MKVAIIGAGLAGLIAARDLQDAGATVTVFDKGRGVGGRCSTRQTDFGPIDHGLQLFDGADPRVMQAIDRFALPAQKIHFKTRGYQPISGSGPFLRPDNGARFAAEIIAEPLDVRPSHHVSQVEHGPTGWTVFCSEESFGSYDSVIFAIPPQQAKVFALHPDTLDLDWPQYSPQVAALAAHDSALDLPETGPLDQEGLAWLSISDDKRRATILADIELSTQLIKTEKDEIAALLWKRITDQAPPAYLGGHRWLYCRVSRAMGSPCFWDADRQLGYCGDWFVGPNAGDAFKSGHSVAVEALKSIKA